MKKSYSYQEITAVTEKRLNQFIVEAIANPENVDTYQNSFVNTFWLWYEITRDETNPDRDADGTRFMDLLMEFPEKAGP